MGTQENKAIATSFYTKFSDGDVAGAVDLLHEDITWWLPGHDDELRTEECTQRTVLSRSSTGWSRASRTACG